MLPDQQNGQLVFVQAHPERETKWSEGEIHNNLSKSSHIVNQWFSAT